MEAIEIIMKIWGIEEESRAELERALKGSSEKHLGLLLMNLSAGSENEEFQAKNDEWMATYLPEVQFCSTSEIELLRG